MGEISAEDQAHFTLLVQQWNTWTSLPPDEQILETLQPELKVAWQERSQVIGPILQENGGPLTWKQALFFFVDEVCVPISHGLDHDPRVTDE